MSSVATKAQETLARKLHAKDLLGGVTERPFEYLSPTERARYLDFAAVALGALQSERKAKDGTALPPRRTKRAQRLAAQIRVEADRKSGRETPSWIVSLADPDGVAAHMAEADERLKHLSFEEEFRARGRSWTEATPTGEPVLRHGQYSLPSVTELAEMLLKLPKDHKIFGNSQGGYDCKCGARWDWTKAEKELADGHVARIQAAELLRLLSAGKR